MRQIFVLLAIVAVVIAQSHKDQIFNLPGLKHKITFNQYSGYKTVDSTNNRNLFYWFVESQNDPSTDPLVLWLNGGPGCSSLGGFFTEQGPFRPHQNGKDLASNPFAWNRNASVIFLESPAGVGFSYSNVTTDYNTGDVQTANDAYNFLQQFFQDYTEYQGREFWVSGESYGGHYVPELADRIVTGNTNNEGININIKGFLAGNPWTYMPFDNRGAVDFWWAHSTISDETYQGIISNCNFSQIGPLKNSPRDACDSFLNTATTEQGNINIYDIYVNVCTQSLNFVQQMAKSGSAFHKYISKNMQKNVEGRWPPYHPCTENFMATYLNRPDVQAAIHADISYPWVQCSNIVNYNYSDVEKSVIPIYQKYIASGQLSMLVYSGDVDAIVPITGTRAWIASLQLEVTAPWRPWNLEGQVGGYTVEYDGLTFASVRGAGHMVPETQPARALALLNSFIFNGHLPQ